MHLLRANKQYGAVHKWRGDPFQLGTVVEFVNLALKTSTGLFTVSKTSVLRLPSLLVVCGFCFPASSPDLNCPSGGNCYVHVSVSDAYQYQGAKAKCEAIGTDIININTATEYTDIKTWLATKGEWFLMGELKIVLVLLVLCKFRFCVYLQNIAQSPDSRTP